MLKGKEKLVGTILVVLLGIAGALGFQSDVVKESICGVPAASASK